MSITSQEFHGLAKGKLKGKLKFEKAKEAPGKSKKSTAQKTTPHMNYTQRIAYDKVDTSKSMTRAQYRAYVLGE